MCMPHFSSVITIIAEMLITIIVEMLSTPETLNIVHYVYQHGCSGHYESMVSTKVRCSIDA